jgi:cysteinyl-tRNA synthetase
LGDDFDIHGGGDDLVFPHHENERAECVGCDRLFARTWVHNGMVLVGDEKMSKSLGNFRTLAELLDAWDPRALRLLVLQTHYRRTMEINEDGMTAASAALDRLDSFERRVAGADLLQVIPDENVVEKFRTAMDDDLGTASALAVIFDAVREANRALDTEDVEIASALVAAVHELLVVLGIELSVTSDDASDAGEIDVLVAARTEAKLSKDFAEADRIREELSNRGVVLEDSSSGTIWYRA